MYSGDQSVYLRSVGIFGASGRLRTLCDQFLQPYLVIFTQEKAKFFKKVGNFFKKGIYKWENIRYNSAYNKVVS